MFQEINGTGRSTKNFVAQRAWESKYSNNEKLTNFVAESGLSPKDVPDWQWVTNAAMNHGLGRVSGNRVKGSRFLIIRWLVSR